MFRSKRRVLEIIFNAEVTGARSGVDRIEIFRAYLSQIKDERVKEEIRRILRGLERGDKYSKVYRSYLPDEVVKLVELAETRGLPVASMIKEYVPVKKTVEDLESSLKAQIKVPFFIYAVLVFVFSFVLKQFSEMQRAGVEFSYFSQLIFSSYLWVMGVLGVVLLVLTWFLPERVPVIGKVYKELKALVGLAIARTGFRMGLSSADVVPMLKRYYQAEGRYPLDVSGVLSLLSPFLNEFDRAEVVIATKYGKVEEALGGLMESKLRNVDYLRRTIESAVDNFTKVLVGVPMLPPVMVYLDLLTKVASKVG